MPPQQRGEEGFYSKVTGIIEANLVNEQFGVSELARATGMSRSNLHRKISSISGKSVSQFIREIRLHKALELLRNSNLTVSEVAYRVGFGSATYFTKCFHDHFGFPPGEAASQEPEKELKIEPGDHQIPHAGPTAALDVQKRSLFPMPWIITTVVVIVAAILLIIAFKPFSGKTISKSHVIAVLPIHNDSPGNENDYIVNSLMDEILTKLSSLKGLAVVSRTTSELYRDSHKSLPQIAKELQVDYVLEGSATLLNEQTRIRLQLIKGSTDTHVWSEPYERVITEGNLFRVQEDVALAVARELNLVLNPQQQKEIERKPTENKEAYQAYLLAKELLVRNPLGGNYLTHSQIMRAKQLYERAIALDSAFCEAYAQLGSLYLYNLYKLENEGYSKKAYALLDSGLYCAEKVLSFYDENLKRPRPKDLTYAAAMNLKGRYYGLQTTSEKGERYFDEAHRYMHMTYLDYQAIAGGCTMWNNYLASFEFYFKSRQLAPPDELEYWRSLYTLYNSYRGAGFPVLAMEARHQMFELDLDTTVYYAGLAWSERCNRNYQEAVRYLHWLCKRDSTNALYWTQVSRNYFFLGEKEKAISVILDRVNRLVKEPTDYSSDFVIGYVYRLAGMKEKGDSILYHYVEVMSERCRYPLENTQIGYNPLNVARAYSILGNQAKTLEYIEILKNVQGVDSYMLNELKDWPAFDFVRDTPEFQEVLSTLEKRFNNTHEQIARMLEEHGITPG